MIVLKPHSYTCHRHPGQELAPAVLAALSHDLPAVAFRFRKSRGSRTERMFIVEVVCPQDGGHVVECRGTYHVS